MKKLTSNFKKRMIPLTVVTLLAAAPVFYQNCGTPLAGDDTPNAPSPYSENNGVILSPHLASLKTLPVNTKLNFVVEDACVQDRKARNSTRYFLDRYLAQVTPQVGTKLPQSLIQVTLTVSIETEDLVQIKKTDRCIVGISDDQGVEYGVAQAVAGDGAVTQDYLTRTGYFQSWPAFDAELAPQSVTVATLDSGFDMTRAASVTFADNMIGSNRVEEGSTPNDDHGHGTMIASLITWKKDPETQFVGAATHATKLLPIRILSKAKPKVTLMQVFAAVKHAVNAGADVVTISLGAPSINAANRQVVMCDPAIGHLIFKAIENRTFLVMTAGNYMYCEIINGVEVCRPGPIFSPKDNSFTELHKDTFTPACWARYFKGALSVTAVDSAGKLPSHFANWGGDAVEIAAPGTDVTTQWLQSAYRKDDGTSLSAALVTAAVANTIAFYKKQGWYYNPWIIEDTLLNGSATEPNLQNATGPLVRLQKSLNFNKLATYLTTMKTWTEQQRREQFSDNPESGIVRTVAGSASRSLLKIEVYTKEPLIYIKDQAQIQAVAYYSNADLEVVTDKVTWSLNRADAKITANGIFLPNAAGAFTVTANYSGRTASVALTVSTSSVVTGTAGDLVSIEAVPKAETGTTGTGLRINFVSCNLDPYMTIRARYSDGTIRYIDGQYGTHFLFAKHNGNLYGKGEWDALGVGTPFFYPGREMVIVTLYRGKRSDVPFTLKGTATVVQPRFFFQRALAVDDVNRKVNVWIDMPMEFGRYEAMSTIPGFGIGWPTMEAPPNCLSTNIVRTNTLPAPSSRVLNQSYPITITYDYWGTGTKTPVTDTYQQIAVENPPTAIKFGKQISATTIDPVAKFSPHGWLFSWGTGYLEFGDGSRQNYAHSEITITNLSTDPSAKACTYWKPKTTGEPRWEPYSYYMPGQTVEFEIRHNKYNNLATRAQMTSTEADWTEGRAAVQALTPIDTTPPVVPAADAGCNENLPFAAGAGTLADPFLICTVQQLKGLKTRTTGHFALGASIDLSTLTTNDLPLVFETFDGKGHWLSNLVITDAEQKVRLFYKSDNINVGVFKNTNFANIQLRGADKSGLVSGKYDDGSDISNVYIRDSKFIGGGGIVAPGAGNVTNVRGVNLEAYVDCTGGCSVGGLFGSVKNVSRSYFKGIIGFLSPGTVWNIGGITGQASDFKSIVQDNVVEATIRSGPTGSSIGGIVGNSAGNVYRNKFTGSVLGTNSGEIGGIVGNSYAHGLKVAGNVVNADLEGAGVIGGIMGRVRSPAGFFGNNVRGTITGVSQAGGFMGALDYARFEDNVSGMLVSCTGTLPMCGSAIGSVKHLPNCPTLPTFERNIIEAGKSNGLQPIGSGPLNTPAAPAGISGG